MTIRFGGCLLPFSSQFLFSFIHSFSFIPGFIRYVASSLTETQEECGLKVLENKVLRRMIKPKRGERKE
jgi:hypothetical protein